jgi:hypothetical protein
MGRWQLATSSREERIRSRMQVVTVKSFLAEWGHRDKEEFLEAHPLPVLVGLGTVDVRLLHDPLKLASTAVISVELAPGERDEAPPSSLEGTVITLMGKHGPEQTRIVVGRTEPADIVVDDPSVSERHCSVERRGEGYVVQDLDSTNGTMVNGEPVHFPLAHTLRAEDVLTLGRCSFQFFTPKVLFSYMQIGSGAR